MRIGLMNEITTMNDDYDHHDAALEISGPGLTSLYSLPTLARGHLAKISTVNDRRPAPIPLHHSDLHNRCGGVPGGLSVWDGCTPLTTWLCDQTQLEDTVHTSHKRQPERCGPVLSHQLRPFAMEQLGPGSGQ